MNIQASTYRELKKASSTYEAAKSVLFAQRFRGWMGNLDEQEQFVYAKDGAMEMSLNRPTKRKGQLQAERVMNGEGT